MIGITECTIEYFTVIPVLHNYLNPLINRVLTLGMKLPYFTVSDSIRKIDHHTYGHPDN